MNPGIGKTSKQNTGAKRQADERGRTAIIRGLFSRASVLRCTPEKFLSGKPV
jgi:hypothetical protein